MFTWYSVAAYYPYEFACRFDEIIVTLANEYQSDFHLEGTCLSEEGLIRIEVVCDFKTIENAKSFKKALEKKSLPNVEISEISEECDSLVSEK